jgi:hypothetical protein
VYATDENKVAPAVAAVMNARMMDFSRWIKRHWLSQLRGNIGNFQ